MKTYFANIVSLLRIPFSLGFCAVLLTDGPFRIAIAIFLLIVMTDNADGVIARKSNSETTFGATLDVFTDLFFMVTASVTMAHLNMLPYWIVIVMIAKFIEFRYTSSICTQHQKDHGHMHDPVGRLNAACFYALPATSLLFIEQLDNSSEAITAVCIILTIMAFVSTTMRIRMVQRTKIRN